MSAYDAVEKSKISVATLGKFALEHGKQLQTKNKDAKDEEQLKLDRAEASLNNLVK